MTSQPLSVADADLRALQTVMHQLACGVRLEIICRLIECPLDVGTLAERLQLGMSVVSGHLSHLAECDMVERRTVGRHRIYRLSLRVEAVREPGGTVLIVKMGSHFGIMVTLTETVVRRLLGATEQQPEPDLAAKVITRVPPASLRADML